ncbi:MAG: peptidoglycan DD-metalloendopeptidase family protein [Aeromicrobium erythreum]
MNRKPALALALICALVLGLVGPSWADSKDDLKKKRGEVSGKLGDARKSYDESSAAFARAARALKAAEGRLSAARTHLGETRGQLATARAQDAAMQAKLERSEAQLAAAKARLAQGEAKLEASEKRVQQFTLETLKDGDRGLRAFSELVQGEKPSTFSERMSLNRSVSDAQIATMQRLAAAKVMLRINRDEVQKLRNEVAAARRAAAANLVLKRQLEAKAADQTRAVGDLVEARGAAAGKARKAREDDARLVRELESERASLNARLAALARKDRRDGGKSNGGDGGGTLSYPVNGPITSPYGMRRHPITGVYKLHDGTDFGVGCGTPIRAAASGRIIQQYFNGAYGNRVILANGVKRGQSIVTTYNHLSRFARGAGQKVSRGEVIGYVGSTGYSTGCHLHFMVIANGRTVNPMGWL